MRQKFICGNWKMHGGLEETRALLRNIISQWNDDFKEVEVAVCPPFTSLTTAQQLALDTPIQFGAQNCHFEEKGAFTGEISAAMLAEIGCSYVILGHSERRALFGETDQLINKKIKVALRAGLRPILCIGETIEEREGNKTESVLSTQLTGNLEGITEEDFGRITIAYEPVWAIGTGKTATPEMAEETHLFVRSELAKLYGNPASENTIIQYGGSMKPENAAELLSQPNIDGGLIGGAALKAESFMAIVKAAAEAVPV